MIPHITKRVVSVTLSDIILVLSEPNPLTSRLSAAAREAIGHLGKILDFIYSITASDEICVLSAVQYGRFAQLLHFSLVHPRHRTGSISL